MDERVQMNFPRAKQKLFLILSREATTNGNRQWKHLHPNHWLLFDSVQYESMPDKEQIPSYVMYHNSIYKQHSKCFFDVSFFFVQKDKRKKNQLSKKPNMLLKMLPKTPMVANALAKMGTKVYGTKVYAISDLHLEYFDNWQKIMTKMTWPQADILVLAGDIGYPMGLYQEQYISFLQQMKIKYDNVVFVPGNHEYYQRNLYSREKIDDTLQHIAHRTSCHLLQNSSIELCGVKLLGSTMWTKIDPTLHALMQTTFPNGPFFDMFPSIDRYNEEFTSNYNWLQNELKQPHPQKIIVTHHVPSYSLQHIKYKQHSHGNPDVKRLINSLFYSDILHTLNLTNVAYWFAGHTHEYASIKKGSTRVVVNPHGTPKEQYTRQTNISQEVYII